MCIWQQRRQQQHQHGSVFTLQDLCSSSLLAPDLLRFVVLSPGRRDDCAHVVLQLSLLAGLLCIMNQPCLNFFAPSYFSFGWHVAVVAATGGAVFSVRLALMPSHVEML
jgi:hypothetical protein